MLMQRYTVLYCTAPCSYINTVHALPDTQIHNLACTSILYCPEYEANRGFRHCSIIGKPYLRNFANKTHHGADHLFLCYWVQFLRQLFMIVLCCFCRSRTYSKAYWWVCSFVGAFWARVRTALLDSQ